VIVNKDVYIVSDIGCYASWQSLDVG